MSDRTLDILATLRQMVDSAKAVPMSASCMVNRAEAISLIDQAAAALADDLGEAQRVTKTSLETLERAQAEAQQIIAAAEEKATYLASRTPVMEEATRKATLLERKAVREAEELKREADAFVDSRIASFEAALQKTVAQITTMRVRLSSRSSLDSSDTQMLPKQEG